ncbi:MAG: outer membrane lipoprotein carrier protein LolA [Acidimicrobiia bacterium]|nr:outer membrane lipoprotein carrier protein LolA [Acidimicrobiia bacterium]
MTAMRILSCSLTIALLPVAASANGNLAAVLARLDATSDTFQSMTAGLKRITHTAVINDSSEELGTVRMLRVKKGDLRMLIEFLEPDTTSVAFIGRKAELYYPKTQTVHEYDLGKHRSLVDQFLLLGFGTSGRELSRSYNIKLIGQETVGAYKAARLELTPRSPQLGEHLKKVELWVHDTEGFPVRQKFYQKSGDYTLIEYSGIKWNPPLTPAALQLKLPANVKREFPAK